MSNKKPLKLAVLSTYTGIHSGSWRYHATQSDQLLNMKYYQEMAQIAERGKLDALLIVDVQTLIEREGKPAEEFAIPVSDVMTMLSAMAAVTQRIGLIGTVSTSYNDAYHVAKMFSTLDHISGGRAGWNMVTTQDPIAPFNYSRTQLIDHSQRYERGTEFAMLTKKYWDSWADDAVISNKEAGIYVDSAKIRLVDQQGAYYPSRGQANFPRPLQGYPVLFQAGSSTSGMNLAAQHGEVVFTAQDNMKDAIAFYEGVKNRLSQFGRTHDELVVLPGVAPILASSEQEAKQLLTEFNELIAPEIAVKRLSGVLGIDLSGYAIDGPVPLAEIDPNSSNTFKSRIQLYKDLAERENLSIRQLSYHAMNGSGHYPFVGTPEQLVDFMESWHNAGACDGFNVLISHFNEGLEVFVDHVVPLLQKRGLRSEDYLGTTLRENLGLTRPARI